MPELFPMAGGDITRWLATEAVAEDAAAEVAAVEAAEDYAYYDSDIIVFVGAILL